MEKIRKNFLCTIDVLNTKQSDHFICDRSGGAGEESSGGVENSVLRKIEKRF